MAKYSVDVFISHSWSYSEHYETLAEWFFDTAWQANGLNITFNDLSVPKDDPIHYANNTSQLRAAIHSRIVQSDVVVIPVGMYASYSKWIGEEISGANIYSRPILAVNPWGQERKSSVVLQSSKKLVNWNSKSVVNGAYSLVST